jgi:hypothetical protein
MKRSTFLYTSAGALAVASLPIFAGAAPLESEISLGTSTGTLYGTLGMPAVKGAAPVVLIVPGSGSVDRNGNVWPAQGGSDTYKLLAAALAARGVASVRYDKRGVAQSAEAIPAGGEQSLRFDMYIDDAVAWANLLFADMRFSRVVIAGHSEGSLIGMVTAQRTPVKAFVSLEGAGRPAPIVLRDQLKGRVDAATYAQVETILASLQNGKTIALDAGSSLAPFFRDSVQPYLISWFAYNPTVEIAKVHSPVTIVQGTADLQVSLADATALAKADPRAKLVVVKGMNHMLKYAPDISTPAAVFKGYTDPTLPIDPDVVRAVTRAAQTQAYR